MSDTTLEEALAYLDRHINLEKMAALAGRTEGLSLDRMRVLARVLGDPQDAYPIVHLTGTNGKGSTARMTSALLAAHGLKVGAYTSPHVESVTERIALTLGEVDQRAPIAGEELARIVAELAALEPLLLEELEGERPSYFELLTALALSYFAEVAVEVAVVEVGMLGRFDATNVGSAAVAVVTNVGKDHTDGGPDWRRRIAEEKAGIVDASSTLVLGEPDPDLLPIFEGEGPADLWLRDRDFGCESSAMALGGRLLELRGRHGRYDDVFLPLHGAHQADNAAAAVAAVEALFDRALDVDLVREALGSVELPGRFEVLHRGPLVVLDGAHNPDGARALSATLDGEFTIAGRRIWVVGLLSGRDVDEMLDGLGIGVGPRPGDLVLACTPPSPRGLPADDLANHVGKRGVPVEVVDDVGEALARAWDDVSPGGDGAGDEATSSDMVAVTGSLYTVGAAREAARRLGLVD